MRTSKHMGNAYTLILFLFFSLSICPFVMNTEEEIEQAADHKREIIILPRVSYHLLN